MANDPKIRISADVSGVEESLKRIQSTAERVNKTLASGQVGLDFKQAQADLETLQKGAASLAQTLAQVGKGGGADVPLQKVAAALAEAEKAAVSLDKVMSAVGTPSNVSEQVKQTRALAENLERARRAQEILSKEGIKLSREQVEAARKQFDAWRKSGARGTSRIRDTSFDDWLAGGWRNYSLDESEARRHRDKVLQSVGIDTHRSGSDSFLSRAKQHLNRMPVAAGTLGGVAGSLFAGGGGGIWSTTGQMAGIGAGALAGSAFGGPIGMAAGALLSSVFSGMGGAMDRFVERAGGEAVVYSDLRRAMGSLSTDFEFLRSTVRGATTGLGLSFDEAARMATLFARTAGTASKDLSLHVRDSAGFARAYGLDPNVATQFFATMRHFQTTKDDRDQRRMALYIAEAVKEGGTSLKLDEVLSAISAYVSTTARASLTEANAGAYMSMLSTMTGLNFAGLKSDPNSAASILARADAAFRQGGGMGEASRNFMLAVMQKRFGTDFSTYDLDVLLEGGMFGTMRKQFGPDSPAYKLAERMGDKDAMRRYEHYAQAGGDTLTMAYILQAIKQGYGGSADEFRNAVKRTLNLGDAQAVALIEAFETNGGLGALYRQLQKYLPDMSKLDMRAVAQLAGLTKADRSQLEVQASRLRTLQGDQALTQQERERLDKAMHSGDVEQMRRAIIQLTASRDPAYDQGARMRNVQVEMNNALQKLATELIPATLAIKEGVVEVVRFVSKPFGGSDWVRQQDAEQHRYADTKATAQRLDRQLQELSDRIASFKPDAQAAASMTAVEKQLQERIRQAEARGDTGEAENLRAYLQQVEKQHKAMTVDGLLDLKRRFNDLVRQRNAIEAFPSRWQMVPLNTDATAPKQKPARGDSQWINGVAPAKAIRPAAQASSPEERPPATDKLPGAGSAPSAMPPVSGLGLDDLLLARTAVMKSAWDVAPQPASGAALDKALGYFDRAAPEQASQREAVVRILSAPSDSKVPGMAAGDRQRVEVDVRVTGEVVELDRSMRPTGRAAVLTVEHAKVAGAPVPAGVGHGG